MSISKRLSALLICFMSIIKRLSALFICFVLIFLNTNISYADNSIDVSDDPNNQFASNFIVFCAKAGVNITGLGVTPWIMDKVDEFAAATGRTSQNVIDTVNSKAGLVAGQLGLYEIGDEAWSLMNDLYDYIYQDEDIANNRGSTKLVASTMSFTPYNGKRYYLYVKDNSSNMILKHGTPVVPLSYFYNHINTDGFYPHRLDVSTFSGSKSYTFSKYSNEKIFLSSKYSANQSQGFVYEIYGRTVTLGTVCYYVTSTNSNYIYIGLIQNQSNHAYYTVTQIDALGTTGTKQNHDISLDIPENVSTPQQMEQQQPASGDVNTYNINYNTYNDIVDNSSTVTIINNDPDPDPNAPEYNPYPDNPNYDPNDPSTGTTTDPTSGNGNGGDNESDGIINFPNINFDLPEINWSLGDLSNKFPFSIPFDLVTLVTVLDAPAEAPRFEGTVDFGFTTWDYDINLESFDTVAAVCRSTELVMFIFGLILITRNIIKG